jgi:hypothetical protein
MPDTLDLDTLKDIPEEEEDFSQEFQMRLQHLGFIFLQSMMLGIICSLKSFQGQILRLKSKMLCISL